MLGQTQLQRIIPRSGVRHLTEAVLHTLVSFPPSGKPLSTVVSQWKEWTAKETGIGWQRDFFEHRLRHDESRQQRAEYILENPVREKLVTRSEEWPFLYFADGQRPHFDR